MQVNNFKNICKEAMGADDNELDTGGCNGDSSDVDRRIERTH